jgi:hypothetical protein
MEKYPHYLIIGPMLDDSRAALLDGTAKKGTHLISGPQIRLADGGPEMRCVPFFVNQARCSSSTPFL